MTEALTNPGTNPGTNSGTGPAAGYGEALAELDEILGQLELGDVDVDVLAARVKRAAELITFCRDRIGNARLQIQQVVAELGDGT